MAESRFNPKAGQSTLTEGLADLSDYIDNEVAEQQAYTDDELVPVNASITTLNAAVADSGWITLTYSNSWSNFDNGYPGLAVRKVGNLVYMRGMIKKTTAASAEEIIAIIPVGYRPVTAESQIHAMVAANNLAFAIGIEDTGEVRCKVAQGGATPWVAMYPAPWFVN